MKNKKYSILVSILILLSSCNNPSDSISKSNNSSTSSNKINSSSLISNSSQYENITKNYVISTLKSIKNNSYTLNYSYQGIEYNDIYKPSSYYYNDMVKQGSLLANLYGNNLYSFDFIINNDVLKITNQSYDNNGIQGLNTLNVINLSDYDYSSLEENLIVTPLGIKLENRSFIDFFTYVINDYNSFDYIIFNKLNNHLTMDFYFQNKLYDGYSYVIKNIGNSSNKTIDNYLSKVSKFEKNGTHADETFNVINIVISGDINYNNGINIKNWESLNNTKIYDKNITNYELKSTSNGVSYRQIFQKYPDNSIMKIGLNGSNQVIETNTDLLENDLYPMNAPFLNESFLIDEKNNEYLYLGMNSNNVISSILPNISSIIIEAWIKEIRFIIEDNKIIKFSFNTFDINLGNEYVYFMGEFNLTNDGEIATLVSLTPTEKDIEIKNLLNNLTKENANYTMESISYEDINDELIQLGEKHIINYVNNVYFDANYRINNDQTLQLQFGNGYALYNGKVYSFRYDATINSIDNVKETRFTSIKEAILSLSTEVLVLKDDYIYINDLVTDVSENVGMLEQSGLIDPQTLKFHLDEDKLQINKISYKYGNSYTSAYVEVPITYGNASIDQNILDKLNDAFPKQSEIEEKYLKDSIDQDVQSIYVDLYNNLYGEKADYIPYIPGIENCIDIIWTKDYPEGYQYLISDAPNDYLDIFKESLITIYGYIQTDENIFINNITGLKLEIKEDMGFQQFFFTIL